MTEMEAPRFTRTVDINGFVMEERDNLRFKELIRRMLRFGGMTEQCSKKSENRSWGQQEDWVEHEDNNGIQFVDNPLFEMGT